MAEDLPPLIMADQSASHIIGVHHQSMVHTPLQVDIPSGHTMQHHVCPPCRGGLFFDLHMVLSIFKVYLYLTANTHIELVDWVCLLDSLSELPTPPTHKLRQE